jgi:type I restriction enzyme M protein
MILNKDGQSNLHCEDSIQHHARFSKEMGVVLCNPPFGAKTIESREAVLAHYDLGHVWERDEISREWKKNQEKIVENQQLGILFIERCV